MYKYIQLFKHNKNIVEEHSHESMQLIKCDILYINAEMDQHIADNPIASIKRFYDQKELELTNKYGHILVAKYWPEFESKDSGLM